VWVYCVRSGVCVSVFFLRLSQYTYMVNSSDVTNARLVAAARCARVGVLCAVWGVCVCLCVYHNIHTCLIRMISRMHD